MRSVGRVKKIKGAISADGKPLLTLQYTHATGGRESGNQGRGRILVHCQPQVFGPEPGITGCIQLPPVRSDKQVRFPFNGAGNMQCVHGAQSIFFE